MIKYTLICAREHEFEVWFDKSTDYDDQAEKGLVECPHCGSRKTKKAPMAPYVSGTKAQNLEEMANKVRQEIENNCEHVGANFAEEARAMHYGEKRKRGIYGEATPGEAKALVEEGIGIVPLPPAIAPKPKDKLN